MLMRALAVRRASAAVVIARGSLAESEEEVLKMDPDPDCRVDGENAVCWPCGEKLGLDSSATRRGVVVWSKR